MTENTFRWWHGLAILLAANIISAFPVGYAGDKIFYNSFERPTLAPPDWAFAPVWLFLNITSLVALYRIANGPEGTERTWFIASEAIGWVLFAAFATVFFLMRSPILGAIDTVLGLGAVLVSLTCALRLDRLAALLIALRCLWLLLASYVSVWVALNNVDPFFAR